MFGAAFASDVRDVMSRVPVLTLLQATRDPAVPGQAAEWLTAAVPDARLDVLDVGHFPHVASPPALCGAVTDFVLGEPR